MPTWTAHLPVGMAEGDVDLLAAGNLPLAFARRWATDGSRPALHDDATGWITGGELEQRSRAVAGRYRAAGIAPGDRILLTAASSVDLVIAHIGALRAGLVVVPVNPAYTEREVSHVVGDARPAAAVVDDAARGRWIAAASGGRRIVVVGPDVDLPAGPDPAELDAADVTDPAVIAYTSGTTGAPKGAVLSHGNLLASAAALGLAWRWTPEDRLVLALPLFHLHGLGVGLHGTLVAGASAAIRPSFSPADVLDAVGTHDATLFFGVPTMWSRLAESPRVGELSRLRLGVSGSAPLSADLHAGLAERTGQRLIERYGMTETVMNVSTPYDGERRAGTVGLPLPRVEVRLAPDTGEILLRGPNVFGGYWDRPDANVEAFTDDWFRSGDAGAFDDDGYLRIVGRLKELIISGGYNVYPREVEDVLRTHPAIDDVAVIGVPDPDWGERVVAVVEGPGEPSDEAAILEFAAGQLASYKRPKRVVFLEALPRNALGKVVKDDARRLAT